MTKLLMGLAVFGLATLVQAQGQPISPSKHISKIMARADGTTEQTAYKVQSVHDEYEILAALQLSPKVQSLVIKKKAYDVIEAVDQSGASRKVWFDISSFYPGF